MMIGLQVDSFMQCRVAIKVSRVAYLHIRNANIKKFYEHKSTLISMTWCGTKCNMKKCIVPSSGKRGYWALYTL